MSPGWGMRLRGAWRCLRGLPPYPHALYDRDGQPIRVIGIELREETVVVHLDATSRVDEPACTRVEQCP